RLELFGDIIDSLRSFDAENQRGLGDTDHLCVIPAHEVLFTDESRQRAATRFRANLEGRDVDREEAQALLHHMVQGQYIHGIEFLLSYFYPTPALPTEHFNSGLNVWRLDPFELERAYDQLLSGSKKDFESSDSQIVRPEMNEVYSSLDALQFPGESQTITLTKVRIGDDSTDGTVAILPVSTSDLKEIAATAKQLAAQATEL
ncbi:MAG TPA: hypothetical protein PKC28_00355, partial [Bdellovibrionales bacterium]|nr:hypothetical protein [Bdellovibrionales bacterium]